MYLLASAGMWNHPSVYKLKIQVSISFHLGCSGSFHYFSKQSCYYSHTPPTGKCRKGGEPLGGTNLGYYISSLYHSTELETLHVGCKHVFQASLGDKYITMNIFSSSNSHQLLLTPC